MDKVCLINGLIHTKDKTENFREKPFVDKYHSKVAENLCELSKAKEIELILASPYDYNNGIITEGFVWKNNWKRVTNIEPKLAYNRQRYPNYRFMKIQENLDENKIPVINSMNLCSFMRDKYLTHLKLPEHTIPTALFTKGSSIKDALDYKFEKEELEFDYSRKVMKPRFGMQSQGVFIANNYPKESKLEHSEYILQPYFSNRDDVRGKHEELRMLVSNGKVLSSIISSKIISHQNIRIIDTKKYLPINTLPEYFLEFAKKVDDKLARYGNRIYSIDVGMSKNGTIKIFELNDSPGILGCTEALSEYVKEYSYGLVELFRSCLDNQN